MVNVGGGVGVAVANVGGVVGLSGWFDHVACRWKTWTRVCWRMEGWSTRVLDVASGGLKSAFGDAGSNTAGTIYVRMVFR